MAFASGRSIRTTVVGVALIAVCVVSAGKVLVDAEHARPYEETATVESIVFVEQGERVAVPRVTASFQHDGHSVEAVFIDVDARLASGDQFIVRFDQSDPAAAVPTWQDNSDRGNQRFLAVCLLVAALLGAALVRTERDSEDRPAVDFGSGALAS